MAKRLAEAKIRGEDGKFAPYDIAPPSNPEVYGMGHALYSTAPDYIQFLRMFLNRGKLAIACSRKRASTGCLLTGWMTFEKALTAAPALIAEFDPFPGARRTYGLASFATKLTFRTTFSWLTKLGRRSQHALLVRSQERRRSRLYTDGGRPRYRRCWPLGAAAATKRRQRSTAELAALGESRAVIADSAPAQPANGHIFGQTLRQSRGGNREVASC
jgi:hypothetical protein